MKKTELITNIVEFHRRVNRSVRQSSPDAWMQLSMTVPQVKSLFFITNNGSTNFKKLATALKVTPSNLTGVIDRLVEQGLVSRTENPDDRRMMMLKATEKGEALVSELRERRISYLSRALADLSGQELSTIANGLALLARATDSFDNEPVIENARHLRRMFSNIRTFAFVHLVTLEVSFSPSFSHALM